MGAHVSSVIQVLLMHFGSSVTEPKVAFEIVVPRRVTSMDRHLGHHTDCVVLSAANRAAFQGYVHELLSAGHHAEAEAAWDSVFEVVHRPWAGPVVELPPLRPMRIVVCTKTDCIRCREGRSGFVFPFLGPWSRRRDIVAHGLDPATAWEAYNHNEATMDRILIAMYSSGWQVPDFCPPIWDRPPQKRCSQPGVLGSSENLDGFHLWHPQFLRVKKGAPTRGIELREPWWHGCQPRQMDRNRDSLVIALHVGDRPATIAKVVEGVFAVNAKVTPRHRAVCTHSMVALPGWSSPADRWRSFGLLLMVMFGTWGDRGPASAIRRQSPIKCAEDNDVTLPLEESQGSPSRKRTSATPTANTALEVVAEKRVRAWRQAHHMEREEDFAWAFPTQEAAVLAGGHCLAEAWLAARARQEAQVLPVAAEMAASLNPRPTIAPELRIRAKPKAWGKLRRRPVRLRENTSDASEAINRPVFALTQVFASLGALKPEGMMTSRLQREWEQSCQRLSQQLVTNAQNAIQTATELNLLHGGSGTPCHVDLDAYLHCKEATTAPCRALNRLRWLCKHGQLGWDVSSLVAPTSRSRKADKTQALVVLPPMFPFLEERVEQLYGKFKTFVGRVFLLTGLSGRAAWGTSMSSARSSVSWVNPPFTASARRGNRPGRGLDSPFAFQQCSTVDFHGPRRWSSRWRNSR